jgi:hypothetical protein
VKIISLFSSILFWVKKTRFVWLQNALLSDFVSGHDSSVTLSESRLSHTKVRHQLLNSKAQSYRAVFWYPVLTKGPRQIDKGSLHSKLKKSKTVYWICTSFVVLSVNNYISRSIHQNLKKNILVCFSVQITHLSLHAYSHSSDEPHREGTVLLHSDAVS